MQMLLVWTHPMCSYLVSKITLYSIDTAFENIVGKGEIAQEQFLLFPQCFLLNQINVSPFVHIFDIISLFAAELEEPKIGISGKGLKYRSHLIHFSHQMW